jgi:hypothetical protein
MADAAKWLKALSDEDLQFIKRFVLESGSIKAMAAQYGVSYPTMRGRLDRLIEKIRVAESPGAADPVERTVRLMVAEGSLGMEQARRILRAYREAANEEGQRHDGE